MMNIVLRLRAGIARLKTFKYLKQLTIIASAGAVLGSVTLYHHLNQAPPNSAPRQTAPQPTTKQALVQPSQTTTPPKPKISPKPAASPPVNKPTPQPAAPTLDSIVASINDKLKAYGVSATLQPTQNSYTYSTWSALSQSDADSLQQFATYLTDEFTKYPQDLVKNSGLTSIGLVKSLVVSGQGRFAAPAPSISGMLYDVIGLTNSGSTFAREVVSHEYWHYLDYRINHAYRYSDSEWSNCNPGGFSYGSGGASAYSENYHGSFHPQQGFITQYATYAIEEDKAELFGWLIYSPSIVKNLYASDSNLQCKANRLTEIVHALSPTMTF